MTQPILLKRSAVPGKVPGIADLSLSELGINTHDGAIYLKKSAFGVESIVRIGETALTGDVTGSGTGSIALTLAASGVSAGTYGSGAQIPRFDVDAKGRITGVSLVTVAPAFSNVTGKPTTLVGYGITDAVNSADAAATAQPNKLLYLDGSGLLPTGITGNAATATKLATARSIGLVGDATGSASFDGSQGVNLTVSLAFSGAVPGTYGSSALVPVVTVDNKGRVTGITAQALDYGSLANKPTTLAGYGIADAYTRTEVDSRIQAVIGAAPEALDTLAEIAAQLQSDESAAAALTTTVAGKADKATTLVGYGITDAVNVSDTATVAAANKLLYLNSSAELPANITGTAPKLKTARNFSITGDVTASAQSFDGSGNVVLNASLPNVMTAGTYGSTTELPVVTVDEKGRVTNIQTVTITAANAGVPGITSAPGTQYIGINQASPTARFQVTDGNADVKVGESSGVARVLAATGLTSGATGGASLATKADGAIAGEFSSFISTDTGTVFGFGRGGWTVARATGGNGMAVGTDNNAPLVLGTNGAERLRIAGTGAVTIGGTLAVTGTITATGGVVGNASTATKLATARSINGTQFDGSQDITIRTGYWPVNVISTAAANAQVDVVNVMAYTGGQSTLTLPANPSPGDTVPVDNATGRTDLIIARNGNLLCGYAEDLTFDRAGPMAFRFISPALGWRLA